MKSTIKILFLLIFAIIVADAKFSKKAQNSAMHLAVNYKDKFNKVLEDSGLKKEFIDSKPEIVKNTYVLTTTSENNMLTIVSDKKNLKSVLFSLKVDTNKTMTSDMASMVFSTVVALINPYMLKEGRDEIVKKLGLGDNSTAIANYQQYHFDIDGYHISSSVIPNVGYIIKIDRVEKKREEQTIHSGDSCRAFLFVDPLGYEASKLAEDAVNKYSNQYAKEQYAKLEIYDEETLKMIANDNINAFRDLAQASNKKLLQKVIAKYCAVDMCGYEDLNNMYKEELEKSKQ